MGFSEGIYFLWLVELALEPVLVLVLVTRKVWKRFPWFTAYCVWAMVGDIATYAAFQHRDIASIVYVVNETLSVILALALIYEIFAHLLTSHLALRNLASLTLQLVCIVLVFLGGIVLYAHAPIGAKGIALAMLVVEEAYRILEVGLIMFLFLFSSAFGLRWRQQIFGIVLGLGISAAVKLVTVTLAPRSFMAAGILNVATMLAYDVSCLIWIGYMLAPEHATVSVDLPKRAQLEQWNQAITELIHQ